MQLPADPIRVERVPLSETDDYKPCVAQLPSDELLLTAFHQHKRDGNKVMEQTLLFRSKDGGKSWSKAEKLDLLGREPMASRRRSKFGRERYTSSRSADSQNLAKPCDALGIS